MPTATQKINSVIEFSKHLDGFYEERLPLENQCSGFHDLLYLQLRGGPFKLEEFNNFHVNIRPIVLSFLKGKVLQDDFTWHTDYNWAEYFDKNK